MPAASFPFYVPMMRAHAGYLSWIVVNEVGVEIQDLLHTESARSAPLPCARDLGEFWRRSLARIEVPRSVHGPELVSSQCQDHRLGALRAGMELAASIGARHLLAHPRLGSLSGPTRDAAIDFWRLVAEESHGRGIVLTLENTDEGEPETMDAFCGALGTEATGLCLDVGHAHMSSSACLERWLDVFGPRLRYVHLYNATRGSSSHRALGAGEIDVEAFLGRLACRRMPVPVCLEMDVPQILGSTPWLSARGFFRLRSPEADLF